MGNDGLYCPVEECEENHGGNCALKQNLPLGFAAAALYMPGQTNFMAPFGPALGMLANSTMAEGEPPMTESWGMWRNCPRLKARDQRK
jgi:hypothetical protein